MVGNLTPALDHEMPPEPILREGKTSVSSDLFGKELIQREKSLGVFLGVLELHPVEQGVRASVTTAYFRMVQVAKDGEITLMPFERLEESGHDVVGTRLLGENPPGFIP